MLSGVVVVAAFGGLAGLGAFLVVALFRVSSPDSGSPDAEAASPEHTDY
jgi:hypothetical protein